MQNEHTAHLPDHVDRVAFRKLTEVSTVDDEHPLGRAKSLEESVSTFDVIHGGRIEVEIQQ